MANHTTIETTEYFKARLLSRTSVGRDDECWLWQGGTRSNGYGSFAVKRDGQWTKTTAHRISFRVFCGEIPDGFEVDHLCRNRACVNPSHLEAVTVAENRRRRNEAKTHCSNGHLYTPANTRHYTDTDGYPFRKCLDCQRAWGLSHRRR